MMNVYSHLSISFGPVTTVVYLLDLMCYLFIYRSLNNCYELIRGALTAISKV